MERAVPVLPADDLGVAKDFYASTLGFEVLFEASEDGRNACVSFEVDDADAYFEEWSRKVAVLRAPRNEEWGARTFDLLDPFGNTIFVMGPVVTKNE
jgi:catechol 2,3-dioxygenase-like lactoylglutathione lyase family enzyme